jgi:hypothetical protein
MSQIVKLSKEEVALCADMGLHRWLMKFGSVDRPNYAGENKRYMEPELMANVRSIVAEYAVSKLWQLPHVLPFYPNSEHSFRKDIPDVLPNLEVKNMRTRDAVPLFPKDIRAGMLLVGTRVLDDDYFSQVEVYGWIPVEQCQQDDWWSVEMDGKRLCWRVPTSAFTDTKPTSSPQQSLHSNA